MTYTPSSALDIIEHFEFNNFDGTNPIYYESVYNSTTGQYTDTINFGYGINLTAAEDAALAGRPTRKDEIIQWLSENGVEVDIVNDTIAGVDWSSFSTASLATNGDGQSLADSMNSYLTTDGFVSGNDYTEAAANVANSYINAITIPFLRQNISNFDSLPVTTQWALESMAYNGSTLGPIAYGAAEANDLSRLATDLAFDSSQANPSESGLEERYLGSGLLAMGVIPTYNDTNVITSVDTSGAKASDIIGFLTAISQSNSWGWDGSSAENYVDEWGSGPATSYATVVSLLEYSLLSQGYYVTQPGDVGSSNLDTASNIVANNSISIVDSAELARLNESLGWSYQGSGAGSLTYIPTASDTPGTFTDTLSDLKSSSPNESYIYDPNVEGNNTVGNKVYAIGNLLPNDPARAAGDLNIIGDDGRGLLLVANGYWANFTVDPPSGGLIEATSMSVTITDSSGNVIGTDAVNLAADTVTFVPINNNPPGPTWNGPVIFAPPPVYTGSGGNSGGDNGDGSDDSDPYIYQPGTGGSPDTIDPTTGQVVSADGGSSADGSDADQLAGDFSTSENTDPIVLDLSGNNAGVQLTSLANSSAYFDLYDTGYAVHTGWVGPTTGILVNTTDPTNITDLFGNSSTSGFAALQAADTNGDGVLNSSDAGWSSLYVWVDANGDGVVDPGEVKSMSNLGITSISLNTSVEDVTINGNYIGDVATFTYSNGSTGQVAEAYFNNTAMDSTYTGSYTLNPTAFLLPDLRGYGTMPDLYIAESLNPTLLNDVASLAGESIADAATFGQQVTNILYEWAGVAGVDPTSRGGYVNAQDLETLEAVVGESYASYNVDGANGVDGDPNPPDGPLGAGLESAFNVLFTAEEERLLAQGPLAQYLSGVSYNYNTDSMTGTTDFSALVTAVGSDMPSDSTALPYLATLGQFMDQLASDLGVSNSTFDTALASDFATAGLTMSSASVDNLHYLTPTFDGSGDATYTLDSGGAIVVGETGSTNILAVGNNMSDLTQVVLNNVQTLDLQGTDVVTLTAAELSGLGAAVSSSAATIYASSAGTYDLSGLNETGSFSLSAVNTDANVTLIGDGEAGQYIYGGSGTDTLEAGSGVGAVLVAGSGNTTLIAGSGGDTLYDGSGVDTLVGGTGSDTFYLSNATSGTTVTGGSASDTLVAGTSEISGVSISGVQTLELGGYYLTLTASQFGSFSAIENGYYLQGYTGTTDTMYAADGGTYDLASAAVSGLFDLSATNTSDSVTLIGNDQDGQTLTAGAGNDALAAGNGAGDILIASSGTDTLTAGNGGDSLYDGTGIDTLVGGTGSDTFYLSNATSGTTVTGGSATDTLVAGASDISGVSISGVQTLEVGGYSVDLTASQFAGFSAIENGYYLQGYTGTTDTLNAANGGTYNLASTTVTGIFDLSAANTSDNVTLIGNDQDGQTLTGGAGTDTLTAGNGAGDVLYAGSGNTTLTAGNGGDTLYDGSGVDALVGGMGSDTFYIGSGTSGTTVTGGSASDTLVAGTSDISGVTVSGVQTLEVGGYSVNLTAGQFAGFSAVENEYYLQGYTGATDTLNAADGGTYDLGSSAVTGLFDLSASNTSDNVTLIGNDQDGQTLTGGAGTDTLTAGNGAGDILYAGTGDTTLTAGSGTDTFYGSSGTNAYQFGSGFGQDTIYDAGANGAAAGTVAFGSGITDEDLWFQQSGNDLVVDLIGTSSQIDISNWYSGGGNQVASFTANGLTLDSQLASLVSAMATFSANNPGFNPATATGMPTDTTLQNAIAAAWHT